MRNSLFILLILTAFGLRSQVDIGVTQITSPVTGCSLGATENVVVKIFNYGTDMSGVPFSVSYTINGGAAQTDPIVSFASFLSNSTVTYTISIPANLSTAGTYTLTATATAAADVNMTNDAVTNYIVTNNAPSVGGTIAGGTNVCDGTNSGVLSLSGQTGSILNWEYSTDGGATWFTLSNTTNNQSYSNLTVQTEYRVRIQNAGCPIAYSDTATLTIDPVTVAGTVSGTATRCISGNSGTLTLSGNTGSVQFWEFSTNGGASWTTIANTSNTQTYTNLTVTTRYRAVVKSGACNQLNSSAAIITISPLSVGGTIASDDTVCAGSNSGTLVLSGHTGTIAWQVSTNGGASFSNVTPANTTTTLNYLNIASNRLYRTRVTSGACAATFSDTASIVVTAATVAGTVGSSDTVCSGTNSGNLSLAGQTGNVIDWEFSTDGGTTWTGIGNTTTSQSFTNVSTNTLYHAIVQNPGCNAAASGAATITVNNPSAGGAVTGATTVCASGNSGVLTLTGSTGSVTGWLSSSDSGATWTPIANTALTQSFNNLTDTTLYAAVVTNGVCPSDTSSGALVIVDEVTVGGVVNSSSTVCYGINADTLDLTGNTGAVQGWEFSTDGGLIWQPISNTDSSQAFANLTINTLYRAVVKNGSCATANSSSATITVDAQAVGGTLYGETTVCSGANSGTLTLIGFNSGVVQWEASTDLGVTWSPIPNTTAFENFSNLTQTTWYQAIVSSGVCPNDTSSLAVINVDAASVGGVVSLSDTVCAGQNGDTLSLSGNTGAVTGWQMSTDGGATWISLANSSLNQSYSNLNTTTMFRTDVKNGVCPSATSVAATIAVDQASNAGTVSSSATVCELYNSGSLSLSGVNGNILDWQSSTDGGITWTSLANTGISQAYSNLSDTTWYRAIAKSGVCADDTSAPAVITVMPKPNISFSATDTCFGFPTPFTNSTTIPSGFIQLYNWDFGDNTNAITGNPTHTYGDTGVYNVTLVALSNAGCLDTLTQQVEIFGKPSAVISLSGAASFCAGDSITISVPVFANNTYLWSPTGDTLSSITIDTAGTWVVLVTDTLTGCSNTDSIMTFVSPSPTVNAGLDDTISLGNSITLQGTGNGSYSWSPSSSLDISTVANPVASPTATTTYTLMITNSDGCTASDSVTVVVVEGYDFTISTVITPNGDGFNDTWYIGNLQFYPDNEVIIFNRYGQKVFGMTGYDNSWDGTFGGNAVPDGTYYYVLKFADSDKSFNGAITVLRAAK